jgi:integrase
MPTYLMRDAHRNYGFRRRVPDDLRPIIGKREIWRSYGPVSFADAKRRHFTEAKAVEDLFAQARQRLVAPDVATEPEPSTTPLRVPTEGQMRDAIMEWFYANEREALAADSHFVAEGRAEAMLDTLRTDAVHLAEQDDEAVARSQLARLLRERGFALPVRELARRGELLLLRALVENAARSIGRMSDLLADHRYDPLFAGVSALGEPRSVSSAFDPKRGSPRLPALAAEELIAAWAAERRPASATRRRYETAFRLLQLVTGIDDVRRITADHVIAFKGARLKDNKDPKTVANDILACNAVCKWGLTNKLIEENPFTGLAPRPSRKMQGVRDGYDDSEAARILTAARAESGWRRWLPWLLAFTGARIGEIAELRRRDVRAEAGVLILDIVPTESRQGKNATFQRMLPVHPAIVDEGFIGYLDTIPSDGPLFPDLLPNSAGRARNAEVNHRRWVRGAVGIIGPRKAPAHSWRHRMEDQLRLIRAPEEVVDAITGRHHPRNAGAGYGKGFRRMPDEVLKELRRIPVPPGL